MKIVLINNNNSGIWGFRRDLITTLIYNGHEVYVFAPGKDFVNEIESLGAKHVQIPIYRFPHFTKDILFCWKLFWRLRTLKPDIVFTMTAKPNTFGAIVSRLAGVRRVIGLVCGSGVVFVSTYKTLKWKIVKRITRLLYKIGLRNMEKVWFLNEDDQKLFVDTSIVSRNKTIVIKSEGVNLNRYSPEKVDLQIVQNLRNEIGIKENTVCILMIARATLSKGVKEFVEASRFAEQWDQSVKFIFVGPTEPNAMDAVDMDYLQPTSTFVYLGSRSTINELLTVADIFVLPSFFGEGIPRTLLEAMAMHKPLITTDNPGCRDTVIDNYNGFIVPIRDSVTLASTIKKLVNDEQKRKLFGENGFTKVCNEFAIEIVIEQVMRDVLYFDNFTIPNFQD
jgi:N,N'-diacetylbacillosaminyl-diphospho-undecaprenol alpha-1,3-N-acetylgalactosaminyltransferase